MENDTPRRMPNVPPFVKFVCANVPMVFDDSLSYYEALCALWHYVQSMTDVINNNATLEEEYIEKFNDLSGEFADLKLWVETYFDNLDVQEEINNKLDAMVENGTMQELVNNYLPHKVSYYDITDQTEEEITDILQTSGEKVIEFQNDYTFTSQKRVTGNTVINLNNHTLIFNVPSVSEDWENCHGFMNFNPTDEFLAYNGNSNITIKNGTMLGGNLSFCHAKNINIENVYFKWCKNNHILEMCALSGLNITGCKFDGIPNGSNGEYVQIENCNYGAFPFFNNSSNPSYDNTPCENVVIKNCQFVEPESENHHFYAGLGTHAGQLGDPYVKNITIDHCIFNDASTYSIQFYRTSNLTIRDSEFISSSTSEPSIHVRLRNGIEGTTISGCKFNGMTRAIETAREYGVIKNIDINNNIFEGYTNSSYLTHGIIEVVDPLSLNINNNIFRNFKQYAIFTKYSADYDQTVQHDTFINGNLFKPLNIMANEIVRLNAGTLYVFNNVFNTDDYTPTAQLVTSSVLSESFSAGGNKFSRNAVYYFRTIYDNKSGFTATRDVMKQVWTGNSNSVTIASGDYHINNWDTLLLTIGGSSYTQTVKLKGYSLQGRLDPRTWRFPVSNSDGTVLSVASITLNSDNELIYSGGAPLRQVVLINE